MSKITLHEVPATKAQTYRTSALIPAPLAETEVLVCG